MLQVTRTIEFTMEAPICLVENCEEQLTVNPKALEILHKISQPVVAVAIVGLYRTGKSYLLNRLAGRNHGECGSGTGIICLVPMMTQADALCLTSS